MTDEERVLKSLQKIFGGSMHAIRGRFELDFFAYSINYLPAANGVTTQGTFQVLADSAFAIVNTTGVVYDTANAYVANLSDDPKFVPFLVQFSDSGSGRDLFNQEVAWDNVIGNSRRPFVWPKVKILDPNTTFTARVNNLSVTDRRVRINFNGFKIFGDIKSFKGR